MWRAADLAAVVTSRAYYNEHDPKAAAWLRALISAGQIADGDVDTRSIIDVTAADVSGYTQCHFFAGIGGWSYALRLAGWPDDRAVWTGSCPCQPFSAAGRQAGFDDKRHLWPVWYTLIRECRPAVVFGEQVASPAGLAWFDLVSTDLEGADYAVGTADLCAASVGAPHIRQRLWFVADTEHAERRAQRGPLEDERDGQDAGRAEAYGEPGTRRTVRGLADDNRPRRGSRRAGEAGDGRDAAREQLAGLRDAVNGMGHPDDARSQGRRERGDGSGQCVAGSSGVADAVSMDDATSPRCQSERLGTEGQARHETRLCGPERGCGIDAWSNLVWLPCTDGKARPTQPGLQPLAYGVSGRVGRLRGYGNAIVPQVAAAFIASYCDVADGVSGDA